MTRIDPIKLTRRLVAFDTVNPPGNERPCLDDLANILSDAGFDITMLSIALDATIWRRGLERVTRRRCASAGVLIRFPWGMRCGVVTRLVAISVMDG